MNAARPIAVRMKVLRTLNGLTQEQVAERSGIGVKSYSSFETCARIESMKLSQLERIAGVYGHSLTSFLTFRPTEEEIREALG